MAKLTLHVEDDLIRVAKEVAAQRNVSVSKLVSDFFRNFSANESEDFDLDKLTPRTRSLVGIISDYDPEDYVDYLEKKYS